MIPSSHPTECSDATEEAADDGRRRSARSDHNLEHELVQLAGRIDWDWIDHEFAPLYRDKGQPGIETRFVIGLLLLKHSLCRHWRDTVGYSSGKASKRNCSR